MTHTTPTPANEDRRKFMAACGKFAIVTPPAVTLLLSTSLNSTAIAASTGGRPNGNENNQGNQNQNQQGNQNQQ